VRRQFWLRHVDIDELPDGSFDTRYAFLHALYRYVFYQRLSVPQRALMHPQSASPASYVFEVRLAFCSRFATVLCRWTRWKIRPE